MRTKAAQPRSSSKKMRKGIVAGVVGIALLAGGTASFATWEAKYSNAGSITTGTLSLTGKNTESQKWKINGSTAVPDITQFRMVPGDVLTFEDQVTLTATGQRMTASLRPQLGNFTEDAALNGFIDYNVQVSDANGVVVFSWNKNTWSNAMVVPITSGTTRVLTMEAEITFASNATAAATQGKTITFADAGLVATQTAAGVN
ncbi:alternate-type signal peptide domain-containing protein [Georgenia yuyongxinii]|uniref:Alternate-type signal peptide domain-containing protein n=1 Tax=Georgenia yuyongxinii TaxID=2589797 RepID=A0A5B8C715_9MICO|nr:alternate-type signal peptide domain-containing protein [Georgenia yuyongxinii]QDC23716.1 alternate-type signal peptide domain-containing protein [Georgenia yuyongxinii]